MAAKGALECGSINYIKCIKMCYVACLVLSTLRALTTDAPLLASTVRNSSRFSRSSSLRAWVGGSGKEVGRGVGWDVADGSGVRCRKKGGWKRDERWSGVEWGAR